MKYLNLTNAFLLGISAGLWIRLREYPSRSWLKCILRCTWCTKIGCLFRNFYGFWIPAALPLRRLTASNSFLVWTKESFEKQKQINTGILLIIQNHLIQKGIAQHYTWVISKQQKNSRMQATKKDKRKVTSQIRFWCVQLWIFVIFINRYGSILAITKRQWSYKRRNLTHGYLYCLDTLLLIHST